MLCKPILIPENLGKGIMLKKASFCFMFTCNFESRKVLLYNSKKLLPIILSSYKTLCILHSERSDKQ